MTTVFFLGFIYEIVRLAWYMELYDWHFRCMEFYAKQFGVWRWTSVEER